MPWTPPATDRNFLRADSWGISLPGLPFVPRGSSEHPDRILTYFLYKYDATWQRKMLTRHAEVGMTHWVLSWGDARDDGGLSLADFRALCLRVKSYGFYVQAKIATKPQNCGNDIPGDPQDQSPDQWQARVDPVFDALAGAVDEYAVWEWDLWNVDGQWSIDALSHMGIRAHGQGASFWYHGSPHNTFWAPTGRYAFWDALGPNCDGVDYQSEGLRWDVPMLQARLVDTLSQFGQQGNVHKLRLFEDLASDQFSGNPKPGDYPNADDGALRGYLACCTRDNISGTDARLWGYGGNGRMPDGGRL